MKLLKLEDWQIKLLETFYKKQTGEERSISNLATNRDILASVKHTCEQFHYNCETCPYWLKNKFNCIWNAHKIIGKDVMAYWDDEIEERVI